MAVKF